MADRNPVRDALKRVIRNLEESQLRFQRAMIKRGEGVAKRALAELQRVPGAPHYPIQFTTDKQRRAFFATKGFGRGIPASRSSPPAVTEAWKAEFIPTRDGGIVALTNADPAMEFIQGARAQGYHQITGWTQVDDVEQQAFSEMQGIAIEEWFIESDPLEGV